MRKGEVMSEIKVNESQEHAGESIESPRPAHPDPRYETLEDLTTAAMFVVEASSFEKQTLWERWSTEGRCAIRPLLDWRDCLRGWLVKVGELDGRSINLSICGSRLNGRDVLFYEAVSQVVDWEQIETWFRANCWPMWDNGTRRAHCDAMNFHHCCEAVNEPERETES